MAGNARLVADTTSFRWMFMNKAGKMQLHIHTAL